VSHRGGTVGKRRNLKLKATLESSSAYLTFKRLVTGAFNVDLIQLSTCTFKRLVPGAFNVDLILSTYTFKRLVPGAYNVDLIGST